MLTSFVNFLLKRVAPALGHFLIIFVGKSMRLKVINDAWIMEAKARKKNVIFAFWHNRLVMMPYFYNYCVRGDNLAIMISRSKDGEIISDVCAKFGLRSVRGSTTRGGKAALRELIKVL
ncbi:MAG TPA: DUF374 domain-containing protein, partial [bacterium]|nr:DUF374 domain-containing protein [bacterium]